VCAAARDPAHDAGRRPRLRMNAALPCAVCSAGCFGTALIASRLGLRTLDARAGAAISVPTATALLVLLAPFTVDPGGFSLAATGLFAAVGCFYPAAVTLLTFKSNEALGPTVTGTVSATAPLFALVTATLFLDETVPARAAIACLGIFVGVALLSWKPLGNDRRFAGLALGWPLAGAVIRGAAQVAAKAGLVMWPNPFAASLIGYLVSSGALLAANRLAPTGRARGSRRSVLLFAATGLLNGAGVLLMYAALARGSVAIVAPIVASYPLVTALASRLVLRDEPVTRVMLAGAVVTVAAVVYLMRAETG
jgi:drug/metabolite transporter (DMT)-like permease